ncbi:hypothetical protein NI17_012290 [Thermobifida halotolerans]|uniref:Uncharacterized protein n=1 Tax=Thermobifida halotolerans TaxID=483545 RepID=A0AA97M1P2_9ACTN|nr:hypothetical protein [Thermobifida halotolerans]UOE17693.1 hypothetical protein NI17_012290 [Thermobifida halotolerans]
MPQPVSPSASGPAPSLLWGARATALVHAALLVFEFATAGQLVAQNLTALPLHSAGAVALHAAAGAQLAVTLLLWRPGGGSPLPAVLSAAAFALGLVQAYLGSHLLLELHVPLALVLVALVTWVLVLVWRPAARS